MTRPDRRERRQAARAKVNPPGSAVPVEVRGQGHGVSPLHDERVEAVVALLVESGARTVLDLGCGSGVLVRRLLETDRVMRIVGIDQSIEALARAAEAIALDHPGGQGRATLRHGSYTAPDEALSGFDAATLVETIEHVDPAELSQVEHAVFGVYRPRLVLLTTPNREYNILYDIPEGSFRHADHRFEWSRARFRRWARGIAERRDYAVRFQDVGPRHPFHGSPTQLAAFTRTEP